ncbi:hypothetical protein [Nocardia gipuzkoensis]|uniref:hypothetical protein n=1 Tax=Nocardia gipuzkoensis TaxID=2749991 RepID=UPI00237E4BB8|nr:hypothetical protein [Nocardia gipuzkoensis]MDE1673781.1 hypothetical protein [Nocardia gipuzkoensis]
MSDELAIPGPNASQRPDFVILGLPKPDGGVIVYASKDLRRAELDYFAEYGENAAFLARPRPIRRGYTLTTEMGRIAIATGTDYADAMRNLFTMWQPPTPDRSIDAPRSLESSHENG